MAVPPRPLGQRGDDQQGGLGLRAQEALDDPLDRGPDARDQRGRVGEPAVPGHPDPQRERQLPLSLRRPPGVRHPGDLLRPIGQLTGHRAHPSLAGGDGEM